MGHLFHFSVLPKNDGVGNPPGISLVKNDRHFFHGTEITSFLVGEIPRYPPEKTNMTSSPKKKKKEMFQKEWPDRLPVPFSVSAELDEKKTLTVFHLWLFHRHHHFMGLFESPPGG